MINKKLKKPIKILLTIEELFDHFNIPFEKQWEGYHTKSGNWDMDKIDELLDMHVTHKVESDHGEGWMTDEANLSVKIKFEVEVDSIVSYEEGEDRKLITTDDEMAEA